MRESIAALALIDRKQDDRRLWLAQWNNNWQCYHFVGGHKHDDESFRECVIREIGEELELQFGSEFFVADAPTSRLAYQSWSKGAQEETFYTIELFEVQLAEGAQQKIDADKRNRWVTEDQIRAQACETGEAVCETMELLLTRANLLESESE